MAKLPPDPRLRGFFVGVPGSGKTTGIAHLVRLGYHVRYCTFENNMQPLLTFGGTEACAANLEVFQFQDNLSGLGQRIEANDPIAFSNFLKFLDTGEYIPPKGEKEKLPPLREWEPDIVLAVDGVSSMGDAAFRRVLKLANRNHSNKRYKEWGSVGAELSSVFEKLNGPRTPCHVIVLAHIKLLGPETYNEDDDDLTKEVKAQKAEYQETKWYVKAPGRTLPLEDTARHFPAMVKAEVIFGKDGKPAYVIRTRPNQGIDIKLPIPNIEDNLPLETGLDTIIKRLQQGAA